jgi:uncharacterized iron-regulated membrane protein
MNGSKWNRKLHRWMSILVALPLLLVILTGILLQFKKEADWIQPPAQRGSTNAPSIPFDQVLEAVMAVPEAQVSGWKDIDRIDVRPDKGILKVQARNSWEIQVDAGTGEILQTAYRRSDLIESLHDGSFFHDKAKLWVFFPAALIFLCLWGTGVYLFFLPYLKRRRNARQNGGS